MNIELRRYKILSETCDGCIYINGHLICDTAEPSALRLPEGEYNVTFRKHPKYGHRAPYLVNHRDGSLIDKGFLIHGNGVFNAKRNDILLGEKCVPGVVVNSRKHFDPLVKRLEKALKNKLSTVTLTITEG